MLLTLLRRNNHRRRILTPSLSHIRHLRSDAALNAIEKAAENKTPVMALYNYPSFSGAFSALFTHLYHSRIQLPCLILPFSSFVPFRVDDLCFEGLKTCYFLDFIGREGFAEELSKRTACEVICFDHRKSTLLNASSRRDRAGKFTYHVDIKKSSSRAVYEYFSSKVDCLNSKEDIVVADSLLKSNDQRSMEFLLKYLEDADLHEWKLPDTQAFSIGISEWRSMMNCVSNPHMYDQLLGMRAEELIARGNVTISTRKDAAQKFLEKPFKLRLGRGFYGECLGVRADSRPDLSDIIGRELSLKSAAAGLRPIGAVVFMQRMRMKICLVSDGSTDTSVVAKEYAGGGTSSYSSCVITTDEYHRWLPFKPSV